MNKLIDLLNEYEEEWVVYTEWEEWEITPTWRQEDWHIWHCNAKTVMFEKSTFDRYICSKSYGFIKWLVENEKIKKEHIVDIAMFYCICIDYRAVIIKLSISDKPIKDLVNMLK